MPTIRWSNGWADRAPTWEELEEHVRASQWFDTTPDEFRFVMQKRAYRWSLTSIVTAGSSEAFFAELARARLVVIEDDKANLKEEK